LNLNKQKHTRIDVRVTMKIALALEAECGRLHQLLIALKRAGARPTTHPFRERDVACLAFAIGLEAIQKITTFEQFEVELRRLTNLRN
jgi:hypothetical protein